MRGALVSVGTAPAAAPPFRAPIALPGCIRRPRHDRAHSAAAAASAGPGCRSPAPAALPGAAPPRRNAAAAAAAAAAGGASAGSAADTKPTAASGAPHAAAEQSSGQQHGSRGESGGVSGVSTGAFLAAGPSDAPPDYHEFDAQPLNALVMGLFRNKMVDALGEDTPEQGYDGIIALTRRLNTKFGSPVETQRRTVGILLSLFPAWLPRMFAFMFARTLPEFSAQLNAVATYATCQWLMGKLKLTDVELDDGRVLPAAGVKVERCRYLEQSGCASVCVNSCKVPTQAFFEEHMGVRLSMTPNYEDFSCQFDFGRSAAPQSEDEAFATPCFARCPTRQLNASRTCTKIQAMEEAFPYQGM